jgi:hypothetical protein
MRRINTVAIGSKAAQNSPPAHRGARVIGADALRILLISQELSDSQERTQDNKDNPNVNVHESRPVGAIPLSNLASRQYTRNIFNGLMSRLIANQWVRAVFRFAFVF